MNNKYKEYDKKYNKKYRQRNKKRIQARYRKYYHQNKERFREYTLKTRYNLSLKQYNKMFESQNGFCAICGQPSNRVLYVDHDHKTGKIRGLLCGGCNWYLGIFENNYDKFTKYLKGNR